MCGAIVCVVLLQVKPVAGKPQGRRVLLLFGGVFIFITSYTHQLQRNSTQHNMPSIKSMKKAARTVKGFVLNKSNAELTTEEATNLQHWGPHGKLLQGV